MKITIAVHHFPPRYVSGAEKETFRVAKGLQRRGHTVQIVCIEDIVAGPAGRLDFQDTEYEGLSVRRLSFCLASAPDPWLWSYNNRWIGEHFRDFLSEEKPDILFLVSGYLMTGSVIEAAKHLGIPTALYLTDFWFLCPRITMLRSNAQLSTLPIESTTCARCLGEEKRRFQWLGKLFPQGMDWYWQQQMKSITRIEQRTNYLRAAMAAVDRVITPSKFLKSMYEQAGFLKDENVFIRQGLDQAPDRADWKRADPNPILQIGYIGQIAAHKGVHVLIDAVHSMKTSKIALTLYGDETAFPSYSRQLRTKMEGDWRIRLAGVFQGAERLKEIMAGFDVTVVPSIWYENSPNAILESLSYGVPVITSDLGGMAELVQHEQNGLLFRMGDAADLALQMQKLVDHPELVSILRENIQPVKLIEAQIEELERLFLQMCAQNSLTAGAV